ncbi:acyl carrier protein [Actinopolyspora alba]|uniref:Acyl carrier protein n=1 Tax=Actinopolyspora alba TaxID=673379 RepID=A0A1I1UPS8_9ACTN|nr:phosphopantetheine-binding protein [Actinopolyspora alba]SFD72739.1 acyl carrier protein [Actinopolyspora alba]
MNRIAETLTEILTNKFNVAAEAVRGEASFEDLELDSLAQVELGELINERFGVALTDEEMLDLNSFDDITALIAERVGSPR